MAGGVTVMHVQTVDYETGRRTVLLKFGPTITISQQYHIVCELMMIDRNMRVFLGPVIKDQGF
jgi:hypothetical protein